ncbi:endoribonuclease YbeY-like [Littorina saxatilis]|uniref:Uncharacterized protein n=1 Tax=Littorina saxatilis TaxID=31220 RepID=A0AAN9BNT5_9CAEN
MTLILKNLQTAVKLNMQHIGKDTNMIRKLMGIYRVDVSVLFVSDDYMSKLNESFRNTQGPTDLFIFPTLEIGEPGSLPLLNEEMDNLGLGDVFLGPAHIQRQCESNGDNFHTVVMATITHGFHHLIGYDHETERQQQLMVKTEGSILENFNKLTGHQCNPLLRQITKTEM